MSTLVKIMIAAALVLGSLGGVAIAQASNGADDPAVELRGPCDEAEHAKDPRCAGTKAPVRQREDRARDDNRQRRNRHRSGARGRQDSSRSHGRHSGRSHAEDR